jgi:SAM-dependent methyltransferase
VDEIARYNRERWEALARADALFTRPALALTRETAAQRIDPEGRLSDLAGRRVLCLAGGGGQQSVAFALLGARVTVLDLSPGQLARDQAAAVHYGVTVQTEEGDMRDLSRFPAASFDLVWQPYSLNFVPDVSQVFRAVARVIRRRGRYHFTCANPYVAGLTERDWDGQGYPLRCPYVEGAVISYPDQAWVYRPGAAAPIDPPREYRHTLGRLVNGLIAAGFAIDHLSDGVDCHPDPAAPPGTWDHFVAFAPPWLGFWAHRTTHQSANP